MRGVLWDLICYNQECPNYYSAEEYWVDNDILPDCPFCQTKLSKKWAAVPPHVSWSTWRI